MARHAPILQIFAREPVPGVVKTRLAAAIGAERATEAYRELTQVTLQHAQHARALGCVAAVELWCTPGTGSPWFDACAITAGATQHLQPAGDLGVRMRTAIAAGLTRAEGVLLIGTDCPVLDAVAIAGAAAMLDTHDTVLGPAEDGGFVLVGARVAVAFDGVRMSTSHAAHDTLGVFARGGVRCGMLPELWDVDEAADLARWQRLRAGTPGAPAMNAGQGTVMPTVHITPAVPNRIISPQKRR
jgi:rSAM/selenodomain-associated transferase 1